MNASTTSSPASRESVPGEEGVAAAGLSSRRGVVASLLIGVAFAVVAALTAPVAALVSRMCWRLEVVSVPYGLVLSALGSMAVVVLARASSRNHGIVAGVMWLLGLAAVMRSTAGGGFLVAGDALGWAFVVFNTLAVLMAMLWGGQQRRARL